MPPRRESPEESIRRMTAAGAVASVGVNAAALAGGKTLSAEFAARLRGREFEGAVVGLAQSRGWRVVTIRPVLTQRKDGSTHYETPFGADGDGFTDGLFVRERVVFAEMKSGTGRLEPRQKLWRDWLRAAGAEWHLFRPEGWPDIERVLA